MSTFGIIGWIRGKTFYYTPAEDRFAIKHRDGTIFEFSSKDIENIERSKTLTLFENRDGWLPWDSYNYSVIRLKNGQRFIVTSLLVPNMDLPLEPEKIKLRKRFYCYPFGAKENLSQSDD